MADTSVVFNVLAKDKASKVFDNIRGKAAVAGAAIGAVLAAGLATGLAGTLEKSKSDALLAAQVGATPEVAAKLGQVSGSLYAKGLGESIQDSTNAIKGVIQNALVPSDASNAAIEAVSSKVMTLGAVMTEESDKVSAAVSTMLKTGMAKSAEEAFDVLTRGTQQGVNKQQDLLDTFTEYPVIFRQLGLDATTSMGLLSQAVAGGARNSDVAADALKEFAIRAQDGSKTSAEAFKALGLNAKSMTQAVAAGGPKATAALGSVLDKLRGIKDPAQRAQIAVGLFGTKSEDMQKALLSMDTSKAVGQLGNVAGAADAAGKTLEQSAGAKLESFKRRAQQALVTTLAQAIPTIEKTFGWLAKNSSWVVPLTAGIAALAGAIYTIVVAMRIWAVVQTVLNLSMWSWPGTWIILAIIVLVAAIVLIATKTTWFQTIWNTVWGAIKAAAEFVFNWIVGGWKWAIGMLVSGVQAWWALFSGTWRKVGEIAASTLNWVGSKISAFVSMIKGLKGKISSAASGMFDGFKNAFRNGLNWIISKWNNLSFTIGGGSFLGMSIPSAHFGTPNIPFLAKGGTITGSGLALVGERGPELLSLNRGAQVTPLTGRSNSAAGSGTVVLEIHSGGTAFDDAIVEIIRRFVRVKGRGDVQIAFGR
ncbi:phage tail tape measure protein [Micromonospora sp. CA-249363]|uniref:phage tail tape measure protein n=1 Tax=Micromonospora sp. CA-249363 TaxID=3239963 RepID=UPI003D8AF21D